jgi:hypothetical protein
MVSFKTSGRFYARHSAGKYQLNVSQLRDAFVGAAMAETRVHRFRDERLYAIASGETPQPLTSGPTLVFHSVPLAASDSGFGFDINALLSQGAELYPQVGSPRRRINLDGVVFYRSSDPPMLPDYYVQLFRNGAVELVDADVAGSGKQLYATEYERKLIRDAGKILRVQAALGVTSPLFFFLALIGARGYRMAVHPMSSYRDHPGTIDRDPVVLPELRVEDYNVDMMSALRPLFDLAWQASGIPNSQNFDASGKWRDPW